MESNNSMIEGLISKKNKVYEHEIIAKRFFLLFVFQLSRLYFDH